MIFFSFLFRVQRNIIKATSNTLKFPPDVTVKFNESVFSSRKRGNREIEADKFLSYSFLAIWNF